MVKLTFLSSLLAKGLKEDEGPTAEEIDRDVENAVTAIKAKKLDTVSTKEVLRANRLNEQNDDNRIYVMDLVPLFKLIGSRTGRIADTLRQECREVFAKRRGSDENIASLEGDLFIMRFPNSSKMKGFQRSALIVNEIGKAILGEQFDAIDVGGLLVITKTEALTDDDGEFSVVRSRSAVDEGGEPMPIMELPDKAPHWMKLRWKEEMASNDQIRIQRLEAAKHQVANKKKRPRTLWRKRNAQDRRHRIGPFPGRDRRAAFDRRGRGY